MILNACLSEIIEEHIDNTYCKELLISELNKLKTIIKKTYTIRKKRKKKELSPEFFRYLIPVSQSPTMVKLSININELHSTAKEIEEIQKTIYKIFFDIYLSTHEYEIDDRETMPCHYTGSYSEKLNRFTD